MKMRTAFEQLCDKLGVAQASPEAEIVSMMVNEMIFSDSEYTDEEIVEEVPKRFARWRARMAPKEVNEGYEIIAAETYRIIVPGTEHRIVLGRIETEFGARFVTWESTTGHIAHDGTDYFWGHYFDNEKAAYADYHRRLLEHYEG